MPKCTVGINTSNSPRELAEAKIQYEQGSCAIVADELSWGYRTDTIQCMAGAPLDRTGKRFNTVTAMPRNEAQRSI